MTDILKEYPVPWKVMPARYIEAANRKMIVLGLDLGLFEFITETINNSVRPRIVDISNSMEVIIERSDMRRICLELRKRGWFLTSSYENEGKVQLRFIERTEEETKRLLRRLLMSLGDDNITDMLKDLYGNIPDD